jgi:hypothetical protein
LIGRGATSATLARIAPKGGVGAASIDRDGLAGVTTASQRGQSRRNKQTNERKPKKMSELKEAEKRSTAARALTIWAQLDDNAKAGVRFGLFPMNVQRIAEAEGYNARALCVGLMECAHQDGGMRA